MPRIPRVAAIAVKARSLAPFLFCHKRVFDSLEWRLVTDHSRTRSNGSNCIRECAKTAHRCPLCKTYVAMRDKSTTFVGIVASVSIVSSKVKAVVDFIAQANSLGQLCVMYVGYKSMLQMLAAYMKERLVTFGVYEGNIFARRKLMKMCDQKSIACLVIPAFFTQRRKNAAATWTTLFCRTTLQMTTLSILRSRTATSTPKNKP